MNRERLIGFSVAPLVRNHAHAISIP